MKTEHMKPDAIAESKDGPIGRDRATRENEEQRLNDRPAARHVVVEDQERIACDRGVSALKEALGTDDEDFCKGILRQLEGLIPCGHWADQTDFYFVLSVLKDAKPVDKAHAILAVQRAVCHLSAMNQAQVLLKPVRFELPADLKIAMANARWDPARLDPQKIKVDDQPARQAGERSVTRLMQTHVMLLEASVGYPKAKQHMIETGAPISARTTEEALLRDGTPAPRRRKGYKNGAPKSSRGLNGSQQAAGHSAYRLKRQMNSITSRKSNGHVPS